MLIQDNSLFPLLLQDKSDLPEQTLSRIKTKLGFTCEKYCDI